MSSVRVRFAPSPTGDPHLGNMRSALFDWLYARHTGGKFILRIEDTDAARTQEGSAEAILASFAWLGLDFDEGPGVGGPHAPYYQSERRHIYAPLVEQLLQADRAYRCYCSPERLTALREEQQLNKLATGYDRRCRDLGTSERADMEHSDAPFTVRLKVPLDGVTTFRDRLRGDIVFENSTKVDPVLIKSDGMPVYHFASVVDDHLMEISHVLRSEDWIPSTPIHIMLYEAFGWTPPEFVHVPLVLGPDRKKLAKRRGHAATLEHKREGYLPEAMFNFLALLGWSPGGDREIMSRSELVELFDLDGLLLHGAVFDHAKLDWMNGEYIRKLQPADLFERCRPFLLEAGLVSAEADTREREYATRVVGLLRDRIKRLAEVVDASQYFFGRQVVIDEKARKKWLDRTGSRAVLTAYANTIETLAGFDAAALEEAARHVAVDLGVGSGQVFHPIRVAVSGRTEGPSLFEIIALLGRETTLSRLRSAANETQP
jgi:glutamyl-tRNA synthetase